MRTTSAVLILLALLGAGCPGDDDEKCSNDTSGDSAGKGGGAFGSGSAKPCADDKDDDGSAGSGGSGKPRGDGNGIGSIGTIGQMSAGGKGGSSGGAGGKGGSGAGGSGAGGSSGGGGDKPGTGSSEGGAQFTAAADGLDEALCECQGMSDLETCTGVSDEERECQNDAVLDVSAAADEWLSCAGELLESALSCVSDAACDVADIQSCPVLSGESVAEEIFAECGAPPSSLSEAISACSGGTDGEPSGSACGDPRYICDGEADCSDGSDEKGCFECKDGTVIPPSWVCDDEDDCSAGEDESAGNCGGSAGPTPPSSPNPDEPDGIEPAQSGPTPPSG